MSGEQVSSERTIRDMYVEAYSEALRDALIDLDDAYRPAQGLDQMVRNIIDHTDIESMMVMDDIFALPAPGSSGPSTRGWWSDAKKWVKKRRCSIALAAVVAALLTAWVASGGTLTIGFAVKGVTVTQPILAALAGGATGAALGSVVKREFPGIC